MNEALARLAAAVGIEAGCWDGLGVWRGLEEGTAAALLRAMGLNPDKDLDGQVRRIEEAPFATPLPAAVMVRADDAAASVHVSLPGSAGNASELAWEVVLESGERRSGRSEIARLTRTEERDAGGRRGFRVTLPLGAAIPPGYHSFHLESPAARTTLIAAPERCHVPAELAAGARRWGLSVQLYALRSTRNWGIGDFTDLALLAGAAGRAGADFIGLNPLHARHLISPERASPYAPSSRFFLDPLYIDVEALVDLREYPGVRTAVSEPVFQARLKAARNSQLVDYPEVAALKLQILELLFRRFDARAQRDGEFNAFVHAGGEALARFAEFEAYRLVSLRTGAAATAAAPADVPAPDSAAMARFRSEAAADIRFQMYLQWHAELQLQAAAAAAFNAGMSLGLYYDLAVGAAGDGAEVWSESGLALRGVSIGAPPDVFSREGQDWGLPPWNPRELEARAYQPFAALLAANMRDAGALRIDHVMALMHLFWIPAGTTGAHGAYVRYPFDFLTGVLALESVRNRCMVIGEDLGSVPVGLRERLQAAGILSYRVLRFERHWDGDGSFRRPWDYPAQSLATPVTHDMPTITEFWEGGDIGRRAALGLPMGPEWSDEERKRREGERSGILALLADIGLAPADRSDPAEVIEALHAAVGRTHSMLAVVQLDDLIGEREPANVPGTDRQYPNWRRKLSLTVDEILADARWARLVEQMRAAGRSG